MGRTVQERGFQVDDRIACDNAAVHGFPDPLLNRLDEFLGNNPADGLVFKDKTLAGIQRLDLDDDVAVLAMTAGLADKTSLTFSCFGNGLPIGDLGLADIGLYLELAEESVNDDGQMEFPHAGHDHLTGLPVNPGLEGGIFFSQLGQSHFHLLLTGLGLGLDGN